MHIVVRAVCRDGLIYVTFIQNSVPAFMVRRLFSKGMVYCKVLAKSHAFVCLFTWFYWLYLSWRGKKKSEIKRWWITSFTFVFLAGITVRSETSLWPQCMYNTNNKLKASISQLMQLLPIQLADEISNNSVRPCE